MADLGIGYPVLVTSQRLRQFEVIDKDADIGLPGDQPEGAVVPGVAIPGLEGTPQAATIQLKKSNFVVQFCWVPTPPTTREEIRIRREEEAAAAGLAFNTGDGE